jgi:hypothetical protein
MCARATKHAIIRFITRNAWRPPKPLWSSGRVGDVGYGLLPALGRTLDHGTLETIRLMAVERVREGEAAPAVIASASTAKIIVAAEARFKVACSVGEYCANVRGVSAWLALGARTHQSPPHQRNLTFDNDLMLAVSDCAAAVCPTVALSGKRTVPGKTGLSYQRPGTILNLTWRVYAS